MQQTREPRFLNLIAAAFTAFTLFAAAANAEPAARPYPEADRLFHADPRWLGGDDASSVKLSDGRTLWLFGDSFVDLTPPYARAEAAFVHNTIAIQSGGDPRTAKMQFVWRKSRTNTPAPFFADAPRHWYWPAGATRVPAGPLVIFLQKIVATPKRGLGFEVAGYALARVDNPDADPAQWRVRVVEQPTAPFDLLPGNAIMADLPHVVVLATRRHGAHGGALVRYEADDFARGDLKRGEWWTGEARGWVRTAKVGKAGPALVMDDAGAECSLHWDQATKLYVHVASYGFGATTIGVRTAPKLTGPWSTPQMVYRPPESGAKNAFVYAGKAHADLTAPQTSAFLVTYVANSFTPKELLAPEGERTLYWPRFAVVPFDAPQKLK